MDFRLISSVQVGWPMMLPSKERRPFAGKVHELKKKHLNNMVMDGKLPLRPGQACPYTLACLPFAPVPTCRYNLRLLVATLQAVLFLRHTPCSSRHDTALDHACFQAVACTLTNLTHLAQFTSFREGHRSWAGSRDLLHPRGADHDSSSVCIGRGAK